MDIYQIFRISLSVLSLGLAISTVEQLTYRRQFATGGLSSWEVLGIRRRGVPGGWVHRITDAVCGFPGVLWVLALRLVALLTILLAGSIPSALCVGVVLALLTTYLLAYRSTLGAEGSDQMNLIVLCMGCLFTFGMHRPMLGLLAVWFIAAQSSFAYLAAGLSKLFSRTWRSGDAMFVIMNTRSFGTKSVATIFRSAPWLSFVSAWSVILFECAFPLALVANPTVMWFLLGLGLFFHLCCALFMGLNSFVWAFAATYPAVIYCNWLLSVKH